MAITQESPEQTVLRDINTAAMEAELELSGVEVVALTGLLLRRDPTDDLDYSVRIRIVDAECKQRREEPVSERDIALHSLFASLRVPEIETPLTNRQLKEYKRLIASYS